MSQLTTPAQTSLNIQFPDPRTLTTEQLKDFISLCRDTLAAFESSLTSRLNCLSESQKVLPSDDTMDTEPLSIPTQTQPTTTLTAEKQPQPEQTLTPPLKTTQP